MTEEDKSKERSDLQWSRLSTYLNPPHALFESKTGTRCDVCVTPIAIRPYVLYG